MLIRLHLHDNQHRGSPVGAVRHIQRTSGRQGERRRLEEVELIK